MIISIIAITIVLIILFCFSFSNTEKVSKKFEKDVDKIIDDHTSFLESLTPRQLEYYSSLDYNHLSRDLVRLEQRIYDLEKPNLPH
jgi:hypothetical protein